MNNPDHISKSLETIFWVKIFKFFDADPGSGMEKIRIRDKHPGSETLGPSVQRSCCPIEYRKVPYRISNVAGPDSAFKLNTYRYRTGSVSVSGSGSSVMITKKLQNKKKY
jgi:hypothetical protein